MLLRLSNVLLDRVQKAEAAALAGSKILSAAELKKDWLISFEGSFRSLIWTLQLPLKHVNDLPESEARQLGLQSWNELLHRLNMLAVSI